MSGCISLFDVLESVNKAVTSEGQKVIDVFKENAQERGLGTLAAGTAAQSLLDSITPWFIHKIQNLVKTNKFIGLKNKYNNLENLRGGELQEGRKELALEYNSVLQQLQLLFNFSKDFVSVVNEQWEKFPYNNAVKNRLTDYFGCLTNETQKVQLQLQQCSNSVLSILSEAEDSSSGLAPTF